MLTACLENRFLNELNSTASNTTSGHRLAASSMACQLSVKGMHEACSTQADDGCITK
jgi:hypothetical protein